MKITCDRQKLHECFQLAALVAPSRSPKPILQNVKLEVSEAGAVLLATDLAESIRVAIPSVDVEAAGSAVLPKDRFGRILAESSDEKLSLETDGQSTVIRGGHSRYTLPSPDPQEYPAIVTFEETKYHEIPARLLREMIRRTVFATDNESSRYALGGILLEMSDDKITAVATDGRRLARMEGPAQAVGGHHAAESSTIVRTKGTQLIERSLSDDDAEVQLAVKGNAVVVRSPRVTVSAQLVEGRFPKWRDVFPRWDAVVRIEQPVGPLHAAVRQAAIVTSEESRGVDFTFGNGTLILAGQTAEVGQSHVELPIGYEGEEITVKLDPRYVADFLRVLNPEKNFTLQVRDAESAALLTTDDGYAYVVMPLARDR